MSQRSEDNATIRAIRAKLEVMASRTPEELEENRQYIKVLRDTSEDERVRMNAAKLLVDIDMKQIDFEVKMYEHDNPAVQKSEIEHKGLPEIPKEITFRIRE